MPPVYDGDDGPAPEEILAPFLGELVGSLPTPYRDALTLTELDGLTQTEMGRRLGLSTSGAKSRVQRGRTMLRERLLDCCDIELDGSSHVVEFSYRRPDPPPQECPCDPDDG
jgi:RNA polymerase sigma-70 factor (ECF subfamily)